MEGDAVVGPQRPRVDAQPFPKTPLQSQRQRRMHATAERREKADAPVPDLIAESFDDHRPVVGHSACGRGLILEIRQQVLDRAIVEAGALAQA